MIAELGRAFYVPADEKEVLVVATYRDGSDLVRKSVPVIAVSGLAVAILRVSMSSSQRKKQYATRCPSPIITG